MDFEGCPYTTHVSCQRVYIIQFRSESSYPNCCCPAFWLRRFVPSPPPRPASRKWRMTFSAYIAVLTRTTDRNCQPEGHRRRLLCASKAHTTQKKLYRMNHQILERVAPETNWLCHRLCVPLASGINENNTHTRARIKTHQMDGPAFVYSAAVSIGGPKPIGAQFSNVRVRVSSAISIIISEFTASRTLKRAALSISGLECRHPDTTAPASNYSYVYTNREPDSNYSPT